MAISEKEYKYLARKSKLIRRHLSDLLIIVDTLEEDGREPEIVEFAYGTSMYLQDLERVLKSAEMVSDKL